MAYCLLYVIAAPPELGASVISELSELKEKVKTSVESSDLVLVIVVLSEDQVPLSVTPTAPSELVSV
jgi:hypothetical protein